MSETGGCGPPHPLSNHQPTLCTNQPRALGETGRRPNCPHSNSHQNPFGFLVAVRARAIRQGLFLQVPVKPTLVWDWLWLWPHYSDDLLIFIDMTAGLRTINSEALNVRINHFGPAALRARTARRVAVGSLIRGGHINTFTERDIVYNRVISRLKIKYKAYNESSYSNIIGRC